MFITLSFLRIGTSTIPSPLTSRSNRWHVLQGCFTDFPWFPLHPLAALLLQNFSCCQGSWVPWASRPCLKDHKSRSNARRTAHKSNGSTGSTWRGRVWRYDLTDGSNDHFVAPRGVGQLKSNKNCSSWCPSSAASCPSLEVASYPSSPEALDLWNEKGSSRAAAKQLF